VSSTAAQGQAARAIFPGRDKKRHPLKLFYYAAVFFLAFLLTAITTASPVWAIDVTISNFTNEGTLNSLVNTAIGGTNYSSITSLTVSGGGILGTADFLFMRNNLSEIRSLDISGVGNTTLPGNAFRNDASHANGRFDHLQSVTPPTSLTSIGSYAFQNCTSLTSFTANNLDSIGSLVFGACTSLTSFTAPILTSIADTAFYGCLNLTYFTAPILTSIGIEAFSNCKSLTSFTANELVSIGNYAFSGCTNLTSFTANKLTSIADDAFSSCRSLTSFTAPILASIGKRAFLSCFSLTSFTAPSSLASIGERAFRNCTSLTHVDLSSCSSLTSITYEVFGHCTSLSTVALPQNLTAIDSNAFSGTASGLVFLVPNVGSYTTWTPPVGVKIYTSDDSIAPTGSTTVPVGGNISFSVTQITGASYQWQKQNGTWANLTGATTRTYSKSGAAIADSGNYRARITFGAIPAFYSAPINLTVTAGAVYTVTFDSQGGSAVAAMTAAPNSAILRPEPPVRSGQTFAGWYKEAACANEWNFSSDTVTANTTLYAKWISGAAYTVTFDSQGGSAVAAMTAAPNSAILRPEPPTRSGQTFAGWYKEAACINEWNFTTDLVTSDITIYAKWNAAAPSAPGAVDSIEIGGFQLTLAPGESFEASLVFRASDGGAPSPAPALSVSLDSASAALVSVEVISPSSARVTALSQPPIFKRGDGANSAIFGEALIVFAATQTLADGSTFQKSATAPLVIADRPLTPVTPTGPVLDEFLEANRELAPSDEFILPGNPQPTITALDAGWYLLKGLDNALIEIEKPVTEVLPECFTPAGRDAANIDIDVSRLVPSGMKALLPLTFRVRAKRSDLVTIFKDTPSLVEPMLASPHDHLDEIFSRMVLQKEIMEGERAGWYTRLVDGVLKPAEAVEKGILEVTGGEALTLTLSYYVLDDAVLEAFERDGYLIVPDGLHDGRILDPIWLNMWKPGYAPGDNSMTGNGSGSAGGGGCSGWSGMGLSVLVLASCLALARRKIF
jgi:uncharacterized repeat protein (TIGR02543 family)